MGELNLSGAGSEGGWQGKERGSWQDPLELWES